MKKYILIVMVILTTCFVRGEINLGINNLENPQVIITPLTPSINYSLVPTVNSSQYWGNYLWTDYNMPLIKLYGGINYSTIDQAYINANFVPYIGATTNVDLNNKNLINVNHINANALLSQDSTSSIGITTNITISSGDFLDMYGLSYRFKTGGASIFIGDIDQSSIGYNGTDFLLNPKAIGTGQLFVLGDENVEGSIFVGSTTVTDLLQSKSTAVSFFLDDGFGDGSFSGDNNLVFNVGKQLNFDSGVADGTSQIYFQSTSLLPTNFAGTINGLSDAFIKNISITTNDLYFTSNTQAQGVLKAKRTTAGNGFDLNVRSGVFGTGNNRFGGNLNLISGNSTGTSTSSILFFSPIGGATGSTDRNPTLQMNITGNDTNVYNNFAVIGTTTLGALTASKLNVTGNAQIDNNIIILGNFSAKRPYAMFSSTQTQTVGAIATATPVTFNITEDSWQVYKSSDNANFSVGLTGDYLIELSMLVSTTSGSNKHVEVWVRKNNVNVPRSNTKVEIATSGQEQTLAVPFILDLNTTDKFTIMWASDTTSAQLLWTQNTSYSPSVPSVIMTITKVSEIAGTPYAGGGF